MYLGCTQRECKPNEIIEKLPGWAKPHEKQLRGPETWKDMLKKCVGRYCELANKKTEQFYAVPSPCLNDHHFKEEELESVGEVSKVCSQLFFKCLYLARIGRADIPWSVNKLARSVSNWTGACDKRVARLLSYIHHTSDYRQHCHVGYTAQQCRLGLFQDSDFAGDLEDSTSISVGVLCIFGSRTFVPISWMCKKQNVSIPQFNRIRNHLIGRWTANGWITCSRFMECGDRSVAFDKQHQNTN